MGNAPFRSVHSPNPNTLFSPWGNYLLIKIQGMDITQRGLVPLLEAVKIASIFLVKFVVTMWTIRLLTITFMEADQTNIDQHRLKSHSAM